MHEALCLNSKMEQNEYLNSIFLISGGGSCTKVVGGGYINFQDTFAGRNLQSYAGLVKSGGAGSSINL